MSDRKLRPPRAKTVSYCTRSNNQFKMVPSKNSASIMFYLEATQLDGVTAKFASFANSTVTATVSRLVGFADSIGTNSG